MKKSIFIALIGAAVLGLTSCTTNNSSSSVSSSSSSSSTVSSSSSVSTSSSSRPSSTVTSSSSSSSSSSSVTSSTVSSSTPSSSSSSSSSNTASSSTPSSSTSSSSSSSSYTPNTSGAYSEWPTADLAELGFTIPEYPADSYDFYDFTIVGLGITLYCYKGNLDASSILEYGEILIDNSFTFVQTSGEVDLYLSADGTVNIGVGYYSDLNCLVISLASVAQAEAWPEDKINNFFGYEISVPSVPGVTEYYWTTATNSEDAAITFTSETDVKDTYLQTLTDAGWVYEYIESDTSLGYEIGDYYLATNVNYPSAGVMFYLEEGTYYIQLTVLDIATSWPTELIQQYFGEVEILSFPNVEEYYVDDSQYEDYGLCIELANADETYEETYKATLVAAGFTVSFDSSSDAYVGVDPTGKVEVMFYLYDDKFEIQIYDYVPVVVKENELTFADETYIQEKNADSTTWIKDDYTVTVTKGSSSTGVGNTNYFSNPLRLYNGQHVVISWGEKSVASLTIDSSSSSNKADITTIGNVVGGEITYGFETATIIIAEGATQVEFDIVTKDSYKQCHLASITFNE